MNCSNCQSSNPDSAKFCMNCGSALVHRCNRCQTELPPTARFCTNCGQAVDSKSSTLPDTSLTSPSSVKSEPVVSDTQLSGERRIVTILFADISGFTAMSEKMDPEQVRSLMNSCFDKLVPIIEKYGGVVDKFIGDEIMALFGAPVAHEDDPVRAMRSALEMMKTLEAFNNHQSVNLGMHVGINTGLVVTGGIGSQGRQQFSVMGDAVNIASRLESISERGEIFVGPDTYKNANSLFTFEILEPIQIKGKSDPVQVYKLLEGKGDSSQKGKFTGLKSHMIGRDTELATLLKVSEAVQAGVGRAVTIIGEPGLGKTRLLSEWQTVLAANDTESSSMHWAMGHCLSYGQGMAYHLLIDLLYSLLKVSPSTPEPEIRRALLKLTEDLFGDKATEVTPYLGHLLTLSSEDAGQEHLRQLDPQVLQTQYLSALRRFIRALATRHSLVLVFEDIHWADPSSTNLLVKLLPLVAEAPLLFCFTTRPVEDAPGWKLVTAAREQMKSSLTVLALKTLSEINSGQLITNLLEVEELPEQIHDLIFKKTEGNPFFMEQITRTLIEQGAIVQEDNRWVARKGIITFKISDNLQGLLLARIDRLPHDIKHSLRVASVIGRQFLVKVLDEVLNELKKSVPLTTHLHEIESAGLINLAQTHPELEYIFLHALVQDAAYESLLREDRKQLHLKVGEVLERLFPDRHEELSGLLAKHFTSAGEIEKAIKYSRKAAWRAESMYAYQEALDHLQSALDLLETEEPSETSIALLEQMGDLHGLLRNDIKAISFYQTALEQWSILVKSDKMIAARLHRKILQRGYVMRWHSRMEQFNEAFSKGKVSRSWLESLLPSTDKESFQGEMVRVLTALANDTVLRFPKDLEKAEGYAQSAVDMAEKLNTTIELSVALQARANIYALHNVPHKYLELSRRRLELSNNPNFNDNPERSQILESVGDALMCIGEYEQAIIHLLEEERLALRIGAIDRQTWSLNLLGMCYLRLDRWEELLKLNKRRKELEQIYSSEQIGPSCIVTALISTGYTLFGDSDQSRELREQAYDVMVLKDGKSPEKWGRMHFQ